MGAQQSTPAGSAPNQAVSACPVKHTTSSPQAPAESACPVKHSTPSSSTPSSSSACPVKHSTPAETPAPETESACPVKGETRQKYKNPNVYNVYSQKIDPTNQMPAVANQQPSANQSVPLPVDRESSTIPKGGTDSTWLYPSPQMFWNALVRKDKTEGVVETDVIDVVRIHNNMNESTWKTILKWEDLHPQQDEDRQPRLLRFLGRPDELSPKAKLKVLFGHSAPFDRHDWIVDRGGKEVRYVIDYYHDEHGAQFDQTPTNMNDFSSIRSIKIEARPAIDDLSSLLDRVILMPLYRLTGRTTYEPLPFFPSKETVSAEEMHKQKLQQYLLQIKENCSNNALRLKECKSEQECMQATIALQTCSANIVCKNFADDFKKSIDSLDSDVNQVEAKYNSMVKCLELFEMDAKKNLSH